MGITDRPPDEILTQISKGYIEQRVPVANRLLERAPNELEECKRMLALVLAATGPVLITKEDIVNGPVVSVVTRESPDLMGTIVEAKVQGPTPVTSQPWTPALPVPVIPPQEPVVRKRKRSQAAKEIIGCRPAPTTPGPAAAASTPPTQMVNGYELLVDYDERRGEHGCKLNDVCWRLRGHEGRCANETYSWEQDGAEAEAVDIISHKTGKKDP